MPKNVYVYQAVEVSRYEFVIAQFDTLRELSNWAGRSYASVATAIADCKIDNRLNCYFTKIKIYTKKNILYTKKMKAVKN